ncbi:hypothetical protein Taro_053832 [Colocasia esculenta]|uniref:Uncharacterized protein n=1 Tax=Colocasia esculenta TaxID=4460 RepID=A0A843XPA0_COLES|nr:hypothetical protein [Colocasia esculenta]
MLLCAAIWLRRPGQSQRDRDARGCRDPVATARAAVTGSRQGRASRHGRDSPLCHDLRREIGETSQQWQGARQAKETGR